MLTRAALSGVKKAAGFAFFAASRPARAMRLRTYFDFERQSFGLFFRGQLARRDIEQERRHTRISEVRGNLRPHSSGSQHCRFFNPHHAALFLLSTRTPM